ncbi:tetratricopeptide repeat protein [Phenylobacterium sp.]|jgi:tetratricopeptide (TPR) repeat protein|uniref:tetratricopeptide repeat protein n=1 Tax=Phenylobacterium sp. TaxID=1871053 RepID=UPI002F41ED55
MTGAALAAGMFAAASAAQADCKFQKVAELPVTMEGLAPRVQVKLNGKDATFGVAVADFFSGVREDTIAAYGMHRSSAPYGMMVRTLGGAERDARAATADELTFGQARFRNVQFLVGGRMDGRIAGLIGENLMGPFDVEYDFANGVMRFFKASGCGGKDLAYWATGQHVSKIALDAPGTLMTEVVGTARLNGHPIRVKFASSGASLLNATAASRVGIQKTSAGTTDAGVVHGSYGAGHEAFVAPFDSFKIGDEEIKNTKLRVTDASMNQVDMLLGSDFFLSHRVLISGSQRAVYFTYNGGPVFRLDGDREPPAAVAPVQVATTGGAAAVPPAAAGAATDEPKTAEAFLRRGAGFAARRELQRAIADFTQAITLEPENAAAYRARGMARAATGQPVLAMADLDEALKRQPNDADALVRRGELYLTTRDPQRAKADFEAALKLSPTNVSLPANIGAAYARAGLYEASIQQLDGWLAAHPRDENAGQVLASRCYARALWGKELETALADCDAALKKDRNSNAMQSRAIVLMRLGRLDDSVTQFAAIIKLQPRDAVALYGRGLAELKKGDRSTGDADLAAATAIAPAVANQFRRMGLAPDGQGVAPAKS